MLEVGRFYFLKDEYFSKFNDKFLMSNHEMVVNCLHGRPCFYAFKDDIGLYWLIPISSQVDKYKRIFDAKVSKYGYCNTILFGTVLGQTRAFLLQNMCPVTDDYIQDIYVDTHTKAVVRVDRQFERELIRTARRVLALQKHGKHIIFPDVDAMCKLLNEDT